MYLDCTCENITKERWEKLMKGAKNLNYRWLVTRLRKKLPSLYDSLCLYYFNPWENDAKVTKTHYILVHSAIEYFIHK